jgi:pimeloyl-ACP methyl ester carboxylesterase
LAFPVILLLAGACITPQIVLESDPGTIDLAEFPLGTELVEVAIDEEVSLRGVFGPADAGAPVVLHFLESGCSITQGSLAFPSLEAIWQLRDAGFASLALDYRGVGASGGKRSSGHLRADARAAFDEACRRSGASERRVLVRGLSIGALAAASLLDGGCRPGALVLVAPVRSETVAVHYAGRKMPEPLGELVGLFFKEATDIDLMAALGGKSVPLLVIQGERDDLLPEEERRFLRYAVRSTRGRFFERAGEDHIDTLLEAHRLLPEEAEFLRELHPLLPPVEERVECALSGLDGSEKASFQERDGWRERLGLVASRWFPDPPALAAALALLPEEPIQRDRDRIEWLRRLPGERLRALPLAALAALLDLNDEAGPLDLDELPAMERLVAQWRAVEADELTPERILAHAAAMRLQDEARLWRAADKRYVELHEGERLYRRGASGVTDPELPPRLCLPPEAAFRQAARLLLKAAGIPERPAGPGALEVWDPAGWRELTLPEPVPAP